LPISPGEVRSRALHARAPGADQRFIDGYCNDVEHRAGLGKE
jgi:hypothetical protein